MINLDSSQKDETVVICQKFINFNDFTIDAVERNYHRLHFLGMTKNGAVK